MPLDAGKRAGPLTGLAARSARHDFILSHLEARPVPDLDGLCLFQAHPQSRLHERPDATKAPPYWAYAWGGGLALAKFLQDHPQKFCQTQLLDCGTGSGLVALTAARLGARVTANDVDPYALAAAECNAALNGVRLQTKGGNLLDGPVPDADWIMVGDGFYEPGLAKTMLAFLRRCHAAGKRILIGDPQRRSLPQHALVELARYEVTDMGGVHATAGVYELR